MLSQQSIRSFVCRQGRTTAAQQSALETCWPRYGVPYQPSPLPLGTLFPENAPIVLEIGFGMGHSLVETATQFANHHFIGIEVHQPGIGQCLYQATQRNLSNLRIIQHDAVEVLENMIQDRSLSRIHIYFSDPWPKKRHHKRRLIQSDFLGLLQKKLEAKGRLHILTDWASYAATIQAAQTQHALLQPSFESHSDHFAAHRPITKFERKAIQAGRQIFEFLYELKNPEETPIEMVRMRSMA